MMMISLYSRPQMFMQPYDPFGVYVYYQNRISKYRHTQPLSPFPHWSLAEHCHHTTVNTVVGL